jgi:penicillin G amidase
MASVSTPVSAPRKPQRVGRGILISLLIVLVIAAGAASWLNSIARSALPQLDGDVIVPGLSAQVKIIRDHHGVPTLEAANLQDLFFAQGYVVAQDRLWQMDSMRRFAGGELSEILGPSFLRHDREQKILGLRAAANKTVELASTQDRAQFELYARGVNAFIDSHRDRLPIEFRLLGYAPRPWTPEDSVLIAAQMVKDLNHYPYRDALDREKILAKLGPELTADLYVNSSWHDRPPTVPRPTLDQQKMNPESDRQNHKSPAHNSVAWIGPEVRDGQPPLQADFDLPLVIGSNNWVISGAHTVTGKPLLSNDMHLGHQMPNLWYEVHLRCESQGGEKSARLPGSGPTPDVGSTPDDQRCRNFDVAGVSLPGLPYVIVGHNQRITWGFTNIGPTTEDVYVETFNQTGQYLTPEGWKNPAVRHEVIRVKGKSDVNLDVMITRHGPIITELILGETRQLSLRWTLYEGLRIPFFDVDSAQTWNEFRNAFSKFDAPGQNVVYADIDGNIGYQATGKIPIRASGDGSLPENGSDNTQEWTGYIPFDNLPSVFNPTGGIIATANARITPDGYPYSISSGWEAPWRTARIYRVLESGKRFSVADMLSLQTDIYSEPDRYFAERFVYAVDHSSDPSALAKQAAEIVRGWDGRMSADSTAPILVTRARRELARLLLEPKLGAAPSDPKLAHSTLSWQTYAWGMQSVWLENVLLHQPRRWLPQGFANYQELLAAAVDGAVRGSDVPKDLSSWKWGAYHTVEIQHPLLGKIPILRRWTGPGIQPQSGSGFSVKAVSRTHGPSERMTVDLANLDQSTLNLVTGEGGNFLSPYYMDQWNAWYEGYTFAWPFSNQAVDASRQHQLILKPQH